MEIVDGRRDSIKNLFLERFRAWSGILNDQIYRDNYVTENDTGLTVALLPSVPLTQAYHVPTETGVGT